MKIYVQPNLRFFGDTDLESLSKERTTKEYKRTPLNQNSSRSMQNLRTTQNQPGSLDSSASKNVRSATSMQNLNKASFL